MTKTKLTLLAGVFGFVYLLAAPHGLGADSAMYHLWQVDSQTKGGKTIGCFVELIAITNDDVVTMNLSVFAERASAEQLKLLTALKITATKFSDGKKKIPIKLHGGWIRSSSGSTVGRIKSVNYGTAFLGAAPGWELFTDMLEGIGKDGVQVGYQTKPGAFDKVIKITEPLPPENWKNLDSCIKNLAQSFR